MKTLSACVALSISLGLPSAQAGPREQAKQLHDRLAGVPPSETILGLMEAEINSGNATAAANRAIDNDAFYNVTLKNFITPWTNIDQNIFEPLNDYTATVIGVIRDDLDFRRILYDDLLYIGASTTGAPAYSTTDNAHFEFLEKQNISLKDNLTQTQQSLHNNLPAAASAGIMTTRAAAMAYFVDGTNRAQLRFTLMNHLCKDLEQLKDLTRAPDRIRQDVTRSPGGDSRIFLNNCVGCHSGMDPLAQAFAYYQFSYEGDDPSGGRITYNDVGQLDPVTGTRVQEKYHINSTNFSYGFITPDDTWTNYWRNGQNQLLGWDSTLPGEGQGAKTMGQELAHSEQFAVCQVEKVFETVCLRSPSNATDRTQVTNLISEFKSNGYRLKPIFANAAIYCMGD